MKLIRLFALFLALVPGASEAQDAEIRARVDECRKLYSTWDERVANAKARGTTNAAEGAQALVGLERAAGVCLFALQNDLEVLKDVPDAWNIKKSAVPSVQERSQDLAARFQTAAPNWRPSTLEGNAIGASFDFKTPKEYLLDAGTVHKKWAAIATKEAPVLGGLVAQLQPRVGLMVDARGCRALWLIDSKEKEKKEKEDDSAETSVLSTEAQIGFCLEALMNDLDVLAKHLRTLATQPRNVKASDISDWQQPTLRGAAIGSVQSIEADIDKYLIDARIVQSAENDKWQIAQRKVAPGLGNMVDSVMDLRSMRQLVSLLFTAEMVLLDMRRDGDLEVFVPEDAKAKTFPTATLFIESEHFFAESSRRAHFSFGGGLAALPALNLLRRQPPEVADTDAEAQPMAESPMEMGAMEMDSKIYPTFQQAFVWDLNGKVHAQVRDRLEVSAYAYFGQSILLDDKSLVERDTDFVGVGLENETGRAEMFYGWFVEARVFDIDLNLIHGESSYLNPRFSIAYGQRWNHRLVPPTGSTIPADDWMKSQVMRFRWNIRNSFVSRDKYQGPLLATFTFGVEREWWPDNTGLPSITSVYFSGDFDLNKIIKKKE